MTEAGAIREKHDGSMLGRGSVSVWLRLLSCTMVVEKRIRRRFLDKYDITLPRFDVMAALDRSPEGMTMGQLSDALLVSNGNVTGVVQSLSRDGYVGSAPSSTDGRSSIVRLTPLGREIFSGLAAAHQDWIDEMFSGLRPEQKTMLFDLLGTLKISLANDKGSEGK